MYKSYPNFQDDNTLQIILFQDAFELVNPLGSAKSKHKVLPFYFTLGNIYPEYRSQINQIQLLLLCVENDFKLFGERKVLQRLIDDLKMLEKGFLNNGITVKANVFCICGDNLGSHLIGGFSQNFSTSDAMCRYCVIKRSHWKSQEYPNLDAPHFTPNLFRQEIEPNLISKPIFNELENFHTSSGLPPCLAHDLFEGVAAYD